MIILNLQHYSIENVKRYKHILFTDNYCALFSQRCQTCIFGKVHEYLVNVIASKKELFKKVINRLNLELILL
ncbi:MAG: hypothetical protein CMD01_03575 [Flavobacteriales bacterium]|nr:hypothetical protein [Flavobacteriales bacterium]MBG16325.1 hypothetical protein [Crocinitomicaceae bacterium]